MERASLFTFPYPCEPRVFLFYNRIFSNYQMSPHSHHYVEFMCLESGSGLFQLPDGTHRLEKGQFIFLDGGVPHGMVVEESTRILNVEFELEPKEESHLSKRILPLPLPPGHPRYFILEDNTNISTLLKMIIGEVTSHRQNQELAVELMIWQLILELGRLIEGQGKLQGNYHVRQALAYLDNHFYEDCSIGGLAQKMGLNRSYLHRIFKEETGLTPRTYLLKVRLERACGLLARTDLPIAEVSDYVGFSSQQYFNHVFRKYKGMTPRQYRLAKQK
jgi:AraC-like DNA-binding protein